MCRPYRCAHSPPNLQDLAGEQSIGLPIGLRQYCTRYALFCAKSPSVDFLAGLFIKITLRVILGVHPCTPWCNIVVSATVRCVVTRYSICNPCGSVASCTESYPCVRDGSGGRTSGATSSRVPLLLMCDCSTHCVPILCVAPAEPIATHSPTVPFRFVFFYA